MQLPLPPTPLRFMAEDDEKFLSIANENALLLKEHGLQANHSLLDLGCGYGRLVYGLNDIWEFNGQYLGIDILKRHIEWCQNNLSEKNPAYVFKHLDIQNDRYNPGGKLSANNWKFDLPDLYFDYACLFSVFTHMYEKEIENYLLEIHRVLEGNGRCLATFFLFDSERLAKITDPGCPLCMSHEFNEYTRYHNADDKLHAIAYDKAFIENLVKKCGFRLIATNFGIWGGGSGSYQDYVVLEKANADE